MDNYYTSYDIAETLYSKGLYCTGTIRKRRGGPDDNELSSQTSEFFRKGNCTYTHYKDKKDVRILSSVYGSELIQKVSHAGNHCKPLSIIEYNNKMKGVDIFDQALAYYCFSHATRKW